MAQVTTIKSDGSMVESIPMDYNEAKEYYNTLKNDGTDNVYVLHYV